MTTNPPADAREFIQWALIELGLKETEADRLGERIGFKGLRRTMYGEFPLTENRRTHILDLVNLRRATGYDVFGKDASVLRPAQSNMPPHHVPPTGERMREDSPVFGSSGEVDFAQCIKWLSDLHERHPQAFRSAAAMIKGLYESLKK